MAVFATIDIQAQLSGSAGAWTSLATDLRTDQNIVCQYGIQSSRLDDRVAGIGSLEFALNNARNNSGATLGYYSPYSDDLRTGFFIGTPVRLAITYSGSTFYKHVGRVAGIDPIYGVRRERAVAVTSNDWMDEAANWKIKGMTTQVNAKVEDAIWRMLGISPVRPTASTLATSQMELPYLNIGVREEETTILQEFDRLARSEFGYIYIRGNTASGGELVFEDRRYRFITASTVATFNDDMVEMRAPLKRGDGFSYLRTTVNPRRVGPVGYETLYYTDDPIFIGASSTIKISAGFRDPNNENVRVGATEVDEPDPSQDYFFGTSQYDNSLIGNLSASFTINSDNVECTFFNAGTVAGVLWGLTVTGRGLYSYQPIRLEFAGNSTAISRFGGQIMEYDFAYQANPTTACTIGQWIVDNFSNVQQPKVETLSFVANSSSAQMVAALRAEPGTRIQVTETVSGTAATHFVNGVTLTIGPRGVIVCQLVLSPDPVGYLAGDFWILGTSQLGSTTRLAL